jgi:hypothetical protein
MNPKVNLSSSDAARLVDLVTKYKSLSVQQVLAYFPDNEDRIRDLMTYFHKTGRLCFSSDHRHIACNNDWAESGNEAVEMAFWAMLDFVDKIEVHYPGMDGVSITAYGGADEYDFVSVLPDKEALVSAQVDSQRPALSDRLIVVLRSFDQIPLVTIQQASAYCVVNDQGKTTYYTTPKELISNEQSTV